MPTDYLLACTQAFGEIDSLVSTHQVYLLALESRSCYPTRLTRKSRRLLLHPLSSSRKDSRQIFRVRRRARRFAYVARIARSRSEARRDEIVRSTRCATGYSHAHTIDSPATAATVLGLLVARDCGESRRNVGRRDSRRPRLSAGKMLVTFTTALLRFRKCYECESRPRSAYLFGFFYAR